MLDINSRERVWPQTAGCLEQEQSAITQSSTVAAKELLFFNKIEDGFHFSLSSEVGLFGRF
jgi:hypothetical protein